MLPSNLIIIVSISLLSLARPLRLVFRDEPSPADQQAYLDAHNAERAQHSASALVWNQTLSDAASTLATGCVFQHSGGTLGPFGENIAAGTGETPAQAVASWNNESTVFDPADPSAGAALHFTQVVWKATTDVGCAYVDCGAGTIFPAEFGSTAFHVCEYFPQGNVIGAFDQNVQ